MSQPSSDQLHVATWDAQAAELKRLRRELHRARIGFSVAIGMLPPELVEACAAEIDRQLDNLDRAYATD